MTQPTAFGRKLPRNDWEGDDFTPGAGGKFVTCGDTAAGRMVAWATNGRIDKDGRIYRASIARDVDGVTLVQLRAEVKAVAHLPLNIPIATGVMTQASVTAHLRAGRGLIVNGLYSTIPRAYRHQLAAAFNHSMFAGYISSTGALRLWDPLNPDTNAYGRVVPLSILWPFLASLHYAVAYVPLQPL